MLEEMISLESHQEGSDDYVHVLIEIIWVAVDCLRMLQVIFKWEIVGSEDKQHGSATKELG